MDLEICIQKLREKLICSDRKTKKSKDEQSVLEINQNPLMVIPW